MFHRPSPRLLTASLLGLLEGALVLSVALPTPATGQRALPSPEERAQLALTISGGKSLGSYQAGVNWGLIQGMKYSIMAGQTGNRRPYELIAVTGASAGNVNALISAVEWCDDRPLARPEKSLFYKIWVRTGWEQLLMPRPYRLRETDHLSILHREFFQRHFAEIDSTLSRAHPAPCDLPIGITLTKQIRGTIALGQLDIPTQRFVSVFRLKTIMEDGQRRLRFLLPEDALRNDSTMGKRVFAIPDSGQTPGGDQVLSSERAYQLSAASSAFPLAFEPEVLEVLDPEMTDGDDCKDAKGKPVTVSSMPWLARGAAAPTETVACRSKAQYLDGGLFDNSPLDLAFHLFRHRRNFEPGSAADTLARLVYIEAGSYRSPLLEARTIDADVEHHGTAAALQMVSQAIPAARKYELHALARELRADPADKRDEWLRVTDRAFPIVGEHLGGFAAFLGRPFREFDFYVGVYDALHFIAAEQCPEEHTREAKKAGGHSACDATLIRSLIEDDDLVLGPYAPPVMAGIYAVEYPDFPAPDVTWPADDEGRSAVFRALLEANGRLLAESEGGCGGRGMIERLVCAGGLNEVLATFRQDQALMEIIDDWASRPGCARERWLTAQVDDCLADATFRELVRNPPLFMSRTAEQVLRQLWRVEASLDQEAETNKRGLVQFAELWFRSAWGKYQDRVDIDPSTIPDGVAPWTKALHLVPHQMAVAAGTKGGEPIGYRPTYHFGPDWAAVMPLSVSYVRPVANPDERWRGHVGLGLLWKREDLMLSALQLTGDWLSAFRWRQPGEPDRNLWGASLTAYGLAGKITVTLRWLPGNESELYNGDDVAVVLGISDFNGLLYWVLR